MTFSSKSFIGLVVGTALNQSKPLMTGCRSSPWNTRVSLCGYFIAQRLLYQHWWDCTWRGKTLTREIKMTKWNKAGALESESDPALTSFMTLSTRSNPSVYSPVKWECEAVVAQRPDHVLQRFLWQWCHLSPVPLSPDPVLCGHAYVLPIYNHSETKVSIGLFSHA